jgi:inorganic phosphate transporter, PiT family
VVNWLVARNIVIGWLLTLPAAAAVGALSYAVIDLLGGSAFGVIVVSVGMVIGAFLLWRANRARPIEPDETISEHPTFGRAPEPEAIPA